MAMHTQNLKADSDPLGAARATLIGVAEPVPASDLSYVREIYLARHENSR
jgi:hypothetical protein